MLYLREGGRPTHGILQQRSSLTPTPRCRSIRARPVVLHDRVVIGHQAELDGHPAAPCPAWLQRPVLNHVSRENGARPTDQPEGPVKAHQCKRRKCQYLLLPKCIMSRSCSLRPGRDPKAAAHYFTVSSPPPIWTLLQGSCSSSFLQRSLCAAGRALAGGPRGRECLGEAESGQLLPR